MTALRYSKPIQSLRVVQAGVQPVVGMLQASGCSNIQIYEFELVPRPTSEMSLVRLSSVPFTDQS